MGQKINPLGFRLGTTQDHHSFWFAKPKKYPAGLQEDQKIRNCIKSYIQKIQNIKKSQRKYEGFGGITHIEIQKQIDLVKVTIYVAFPNLLIIEKEDETQGKKDKTQVKKGKKRRKVRRGPVRGIKGQTRGKKDEPRRMRDRARREIEDETQRLEDEMREIRDKARVKEDKARVKEDEARVKEDEARGTKELQINIQKELHFVKRKHKLDVVITKVESPYEKPNIIAEYIAFQLKNRVSFRVATKKTIELVKKKTKNIKGIQVQIAGRIGGRDIARVERIRRGRLPLQTVHAKIDHCSHIIRTIYGVLGIKVWIFLDWE
uniref:Small ribosomal subunit protein uS3c n=2 Tax=Orchidantha TaxID=4657 RepID=A0A3G2Z4G6_9LILI|nr:ribosomal protein S3 [Orchidantha fimbriata]AYP34463.1 ribosomal protein S3 [Orchidantha maxillarioides]